MKKLLFTLFLLPLSVFASSLNFEIKENDFYEVRIEYSSEKKIDTQKKPNSSVFKKDFDIIYSSKTLNKYGSKTKIKYKYTLFPKKAGILTIPSIQIFDQKTQKTKLTISNYTFERMQKNRNKNISDFKTGIGAFFGFVAGAIFASESEKIKTKKLKQQHEQIKGNKDCSVSYYVGTTFFLLGLIVSFLITYIIRRKIKE